MSTTNLDKNKINSKDTGKGEQTDEKLYLDKALRPEHFDDYIGQETIKNNLFILLESAKGRGTPPEHILFHGPPGLGKTTLAHIIARTLNTNIKITSGPTITKVGDMAAILTNLQPNDILFIDEIHRLNKTIEEVLYPAMESGVLDIIIGKGPAARSIQLDLPPFTLVAATTRTSLISAPLRSRFSGGSYRLENYTVDDLSRIIIRSAKVLSVKIDNEAAKEIAKRSRGTPRIANFYLKRVRDFALFHKSEVTVDIVNNCLKLLEIDNLGLGKIELDYLKTINQKFSGGPVGLSTLAAALNEDQGTLEDVVEPYLLNLGFIEKSVKGRSVTSFGKKHISNNI
jgi:holliday junction DNA helicase RuvB